MISTLAYYGLTDQMPRKVWIAIGAKDWQPSIDYPPLRIVRFRHLVLTNAQAGSIMAKLFHNQSLLYSTISHQAIPQLVAGQFRNWSVP